MLVVAHSASVGRRGGPAYGSAIRFELVCATRTPPPRIDAVCAGGVTPLSDARAYVARATTRASTRGAVEARSASRATRRIARAGMATIVGARGAE